MCSAASLRDAPARIIPRLGDIPVSSASASRDKLRHFAPPRLLSSYHASGAPRVSPRIYATTLIDRDAAPARHHEFERASAII